MTTQNQKIIAYDSPEAAQRATVTGWMSADGHFYGENEDLARYAGCTHRACAGGCGALVAKGAPTRCDACQAVADTERYAAMPKQEWDGEDMLYSDSCERYFPDCAEIIDFLRDSESLTVDDLRLVICEPNMARTIYPNDHFTDELPEGGDVPPALAEAIEALNAVIRKQPPLSWSPGKFAAIVHIDEKDLA